MNIGVVLIIVAAAGLVVLFVLPKISGISRAEKNTVDRRANMDRRQRNVRVPVDRRKKNRRAEDAAKAYVDRLAD